MIYIEVGKKILKQKELPDSSESPSSQSEINNNVIEVKRAISNNKILNFHINPQTLQNYGYRMTQNVPTC